MVFVKVRETYDLHTTKDKMSVIAIHTPKPDIIKRCYPGLLMQCRAYRPYAANVRIACASVLPLDPKGVGTGANDVAPEDIFNPILYKAISNKGMSQLEARINALSMDSGTNFDVSGCGADVEVDGFIDQEADFSTYYALLSDTHGWKHAAPQAGLEMTDLKPLVYELVYNVGDVKTGGTGAAGYFGYPSDTGTAAQSLPRGILGDSKPMPFIPCTYFTGNDDQTGTAVHPGFSFADSALYSGETQVPYLHVVCGVIIIPPSRLHELFYRMVVEWTIEFSTIRSFTDIATYSTLNAIGDATHFLNYNYESAKKAITGDEETILEQDTCMVETNVDIKKVM